MDHVYLVCYDISDPGRWRKIYKTLKDHGVWLQLSVFQCRLDRKNFLKMSDILKGLLDKKEDHLLLIDIGPADVVDIRVESIGRSYLPIKRESVIV